MLTKIYYGFKIAIYDKNSDEISGFCFLLKIIQNILEIDHS